MASGPNRDFHPGATKAYFDWRLDRMVWNDEPEYDPGGNEKPKSAHVYGAPNAEYVDFTLPKWSEEHKAAGGKFTKDGKCVFTGRRQVERTMDFCNNNGSGVRLDYDRPHYRRK